MNYERFPLILKEILNDYSSAIFIPPIGFRQPARCSLNTYSIFKGRLIERNVSTHDSKQFVQIKVTICFMQNSRISEPYYMGHIIWTILYGS